MSDQSDVKVEVYSLPISSITVYQTRAILRRAFEVPIYHLPVGRRSITLSGFSRSKTIEPSVKITVDAHSIDAVILEQTIKYQEHNYDRKEDEKEEAPFVESLQNLTDQIDKLQNELDRISNMRSNIEVCMTKRNVYSSSGKEIALLLDENMWHALENTLTDYSNRVEELDRSDASLRVEISKLNRERTEIQNKLTKLIQKRSEERKRTEHLSKTFDIILMLEVGPGIQDGNVRFEVDYAVNDCSWTPSYDVRIIKSESQQELGQVVQPLPPQTRKKRAQLPPQQTQQESDLVDLELTYYGSINQQTGQDWKHVREVNLCTIDPTLNSEAPSLSCQSVYFTLPPRSVSSIVRGWFSKFGSALSKKTAEDDLHEIKRQQERHLGAEEQKDSSTSNASGSAVHNFPILSIDSEINIPGDGLSHRVLLNKARIKACKRMHYSAPKLSQDAFVKVRCDNNNLDFPLLPGNAQVFDGANFVCNAEIHKAINPHESFDLYLGVNVNIRIQYLPVKRTTAAVSQMLGLAGKHNKCHVERVILIKNAQETVTEITVADQLPKSVEHFITVKLEEPASLALALSRPEQQEKQNGQPYLNDKNNVQWERMALAPGADVRLELKYTVEWPADKQLNVEEL